MNSGSQSAERVRCLRCGANNFPGQAQCWQCRASLPPPEEVGIPARPQPQTFAPLAPAPPRWRAGMLLRLALVGILCAAFAVTLQVWWPGRAEKADRAYMPSPTVVPASRESGAVRMDTGPAWDPSVSAENDPVAAEARRALERAHRELSLPIDGSTRDPQERYSLRGGGSLRAEDVERAQRALRGNPYLREIPSAPSPALRRERGSR